MKFSTNKILTLFFCFIIFNVYAQKNLTTFTKDEGLTSSNILFAHVDTKGIIWAATNFGVSVYYSGKWTPIKYIEGNDGQNKYLGKVLQIFEAKNSDIWVATNRGLFYFNRKYWTYFADSENSSFEISTIFEDSFNNIWIFLEKENGLKDVDQIGFAMLEGKVQIFGGKQWITFTGVIGGSAAVRIGAPPDYFTSYLVDSQDRIWITSLDGLYLYDGKRWSEYNEEHFTSDRCYKIFESNSNEMWVGTANGISTNASGEWKNYEKSKGINGNIIYNFYHDKQNRLWAFSSKDNSFNSLLLFNKTKWKTFTNRDLKLKGNIDNIFDFNGQLLISSSKGMSVFNNSNWQNINRVYDVDINDVFLIKEMSQGIIYIADRAKLYKLTNEGLSEVYEHNGKWQPNIVIEDSKSRIWIGTDRDGAFLFENDTFISNYTIENGLTDNHITSIFEDKQSNIWIVSRNGISKVNE